ncbi:helix-turn-helix domain-containing protein [Kitasatospora sp. NPDC088783]|uniref:helix-turn-helix domain-containing protein n=1 Tax=Kitasatospora sp. NPDC088783 TaxID=3364077 RepID=UPI00381A4691
MTADQRREVVVRVAVEVFAREGFHAATTAAIAERAGVSQPYLFRLFATKRAVFLAAAELATDEAARAFTAAARDAGVAGAGEAGAAEAGTREAVGLAALRARDATGKASGAGNPVGDMDGAGDAGGLATLWVGDTDGATAGEEAGNVTGPTAPRPGDAAGEASTAEKAGVVGEMGGDVRKAGAAGGLAALPGGENAGQAGGARAAAGEEAGNVIGPTALRPGDTAGEASTAEEAGVVGEMGGDVGKAGAAGGLAALPGGEDAGQSGGARAATRDTDGAPDPGRLAALRAAAAGGADGLAALRAGERAWRRMLGPGGPFALQWQLHAAAAGDPVVRAAAARHWGVLWRTVASATGLPDPVLAAFFGRVLLRGAATALRPGPPTAATAATASRLEPPPGTTAATAPRAEPPIDTTVTPLPEPPHGTTAAPHL